MTRSPMIATAIGLGVFCTTAQAQFSARSVTPKVPGISTATGTGGFLQGTDDCNAPHTVLPPGNSSGNPFSTGTTGTTGQSNALCYAFGSSAIDNDVWFDWTSTASGNANVQTCGGTGVDTKAAAYNLATCPAGAPLACNDDACGLQTSITFSASAGASYTIQLGTFPGASGGSGTFNVNVTAPPPCGQYDDGGTENALGLTAGGEMGWIHVFTCIATVDTVESAYGSAMFPGSVTNGNNSRVCVWHCPAGQTSPPNTPPDTTLSTTVVNGDTDILNSISLGTRRTIDPTQTWLWILVSADQIAGEFPGPMDQNNVNPAAWVVGSTLGPGTLDCDNLSNNNVAPLQMSAIGFPAVWLLRASDTTGGSGETGTKLCFGDGSGAPCGCNNESGPGAGGCLNTVGSAGLLCAKGTASVTNDTMSLTADGVINQPGLFFQGNNTIQGGNGTTFGDGVRCCGGSVVRIQVVNPPGTMSPATAEMTETATTNGPAGTILPGDKKCYQYWYRDPAGGGVCGSAFNLTNAVTVTWSA